MTDKQWFNYDLKQRKVLIREAGYAPNAYAYKCFSFLPSMVKEDVLYCLSRKVS